MITRREAERLCKSFLGDNAPPKLPENFAFEVRKMAETPYGFGCVNITNQANLSANGAQFANSGYQTTIIYSMLYFIEIFTFLGSEG